MPIETASPAIGVRHTKVFRLFVRLLAAALIVVVIAALVMRYASGRQSTADAYVTGHVHPIAARVTGTVIEVLIDDNQHVHAGDVLVRLDPEDFRVRKQLAEAQIAQAQAQLAAAQSQAAQARASIASSRANLQKTRLDLGRAKELVNESPRGISQQEYDAALAACDAAVAAADGSEAQLRVAEANGAAASAIIQTGQVNRHDADLNLGYTEIRAPVDGYVGRKNVETGARINAGQTLLSLVEDNVWVVANFKETQLKGIGKGAPVELTIDALSGTVFHGTVDSFSPASGAQFSLLPPDNATGNFTKVVQRVPVKILFDEKQLALISGRAVPGLSVVATIAPDHDGGSGAQSNAADSASTVKKHGGIR